MTRYRSQAALLAAIGTSRHRFERLLTRLTPDDYFNPGVVTTWNAKDLLNHLAAWQRLLIDWYSQGKSGVAMNPSPTGMSRSGIDLLNSLIYERGRNQTLEAVQNEFRAAYSTIHALVAGLGEDELYRPGYYAWTGTLVLADYVAANTCQHDDWAARMLRRWLATHSGS